MNDADIDRFCKKIEGLPLLIDPSSLIEPAPASKYTIIGIKLAPGQVTVPRKNGSYDGQLNEDGQALLERCRCRMYPIKGTIRGKLENRRTGPMFHDDGELSLNTFENLVLIGTVDDLGQLDPTVYKVGGPIATSTIILYEVDEHGVGLAYTKSGSFYAIQLEES